MIAKYISVILASTIKFIGGPLAGLAFGLTWFETAACTVSGMMLSVLAVTFAGKGLQKLMQRFRKEKPKRFSKRTRLAVRVWKRFGIFGIAALTPVILTPIGGTILAVAFRVHLRQILVYMLLSGAFWAILQTLVIYQLPHLKAFFA